MNRPRFSLNSRKSYLWSRSWSLTISISWKYCRSRAHHFWRWNNHLYQYRPGWPFLHNVTQKISLFRTIPHLFIDFSKSPSFPLVRSGKSFSFNIHSKTSPTHQISVETQVTYNYILFVVQTSSFWKVLRKSFNYYFGNEIFMNYTVKKPKWTQNIAVTIGVNLVRVLFWLVNGVVRNVLTFANGI